MVEFLQPNETAVVIVTGKGRSIWDTFVRQRGHVVGNGTGDVACDSYHRYREDIKMLQYLGVGEN